MLECPNDVFSVQKRNIVMNTPTSFISPDILNPYLSGNLVVSASMDVTNVQGLEINQPKFYVNVFLHQSQFMDEQLADRFGQPDNL